MHERWVMDRLLRAGGLDALWPDVTGTLLEMGFNFADIQRGMAQVKNLAGMPKAWYRLAVQHEARAEAELAAGHRVTAAEAAQRAVLCLARARWGMFSDDAEKQRLYDRLNAAYDIVIAHGVDRIERVEVPLDGTSVPALLHLPPGASPDNPVPAVVFYPGMDMIKEYFPVPGRNGFAARGIAILALDAPGHGYSNLRGIKLTGDNAERVGRAAVDLLSARADIDAQRIAAFGIGTGGYFAISLAAEEPRLVATAGVEGGFFYNNVAMLREEPPSRKSRLRYMTGLDDAGLDALMDGMTISGREERIACPLLFVVGEWDELTPVAEAHRLIEAVKVPAQLRIYEGEGHVLGGAMTEVLQTCVDWLADRFAGQPVPEPRAQMLLPTGAA
jgi:fermentation-respiration switch protein FrsA (DUF1100 family)